MKKRTVCVICFALALILLTAALSAVLRPKKSSWGSLWEQYLNEPKNSMDVLYFGSSFVYSGIDPIAVERASGLCGFNMAGSEQIMSVTYRYVAEAVRTQSPEYAVIDLNGVFFVPENEHVINNVEYMPWGVNKLKCIFESLKPEDRFGVFFPIYNYHDRVKELRADDVLWFFRRNVSADRGFTRLETAVKGMRPEPDVMSIPASAEQIESNYQWLKKAAGLLAEKGVTPVLIFVPSWGMYPDAERETLMQRIKEDVPSSVCVDFSAMWREIGIDKDEDFYDLRHLNVTGAQKFSEYLGEWLKAIK